MVGQQTTGDCRRGEEEATELTSKTAIFHWVGKHITMPRYVRFEELPVWQEGARLYNRVLDLLEEPDLPLTPGFRGQLDRASLSISNNIAEGFERATTRELLSFLAIARGSSGEVRSMISVVAGRPRLESCRGGLREIRQIAESCSRQLAAWAGSIDGSPIQGKRYGAAPRQSANGK